MTAAQRTPRGVGLLASVAPVTDPATLADARALAAALPGVSVDPAAVTVLALTFAAGIHIGGWESSPWLHGDVDPFVARGDIVQFDRRSCAGGLIENSTFTDAYDGVFRLQAANTTIRGSTWERISYQRSTRVVVSVCAAALYISPVTPPPPPRQSRGAE